MKQSKVTQGNHSLILGITACLVAIPVLYSTTGCESNKPVSRNQTSYNTSPSSSNDWVGPVGPQGPAGPAGVQGETGPRGDPGANIAGATGERGKSGPAGQQGMTGERGAAGAVVVGKQGPSGAMGPAGDQGERGLAGETGSSTVGTTGLRGATGAAGERGERGATGSRGETLTGPTGAVGRTGDAGTDGIVGESGVQGRTVVGVAGAAGATGAQGSAGERGDSGITGTAGVVASWTPYREFWFEYNGSDLRRDQQSKVTDIVAYLKANPSLEIGIDGSMNPRGSDPQNQSLANRRVDSIRLALENAGISSQRIRVGAFGNPSLLRDRRVEVLLRTTPSGDRTTSTASYPKN
jgi:outer membrane protein OmpA-like peptidoglycan-associated protein